MNAKDAKKAADESYVNSLKSIVDDIKVASADGQYIIEYSRSLPDDMIKALKSLGYHVFTNLFFTRISWTE